MKKGLSVLLIAAALFGFYGGAVNLNDVLACKDYWEEEGEKSTANMNKLEDGLNQLKDNEEAYLDGLDQVAEGEKTLAEGEKTLADGYAALAEGEASFAAAPKKLADGKATLEEKKDSYTAGKAFKEVVDKSSNGLSDNGAFGIIKSLLSKAGVNGVPDSYKDMKDTLASLKELKAGADNITGMDKEKAFKVAVASQDAKTQESLAKAGVTSYAALEKTIPVAEDGLASLNEMKGKVDAFTGKTEAQLKEILVANSADLADAGITSYAALEENEAKLSAGKAKIDAVEAATKDMTTEQKKEFFVAQSEELAKAGITSYTALVENEAKLSAGKAKIDTLAGMSEDQRKDAFVKENETLAAANITDYATLVGSINALSAGKQQIDTLASNKDALKNYIVANNADLKKAGISSYSDLTSSLEKAAEGVANIDHAADQLFAKSEAERKEYFVQQNDDLKALGINSYAELEAAANDGDETAKAAKTQIDGLAASKDAFKDYLAKKNGQSSYAALVTNKETLADAKNQVDSNADQIFAMPESNRKDYFVSNNADLKDKGITTYAQLEGQLTALTNGKDQIDTLAGLDADTLKAQLIANNDDLKAAGINDYATLEAKSAALTAGKAKVDALSGLSGDELKNALVAGESALADAGITNYATLAAKSKALTEGKATVDGASKQLDGADSDKALAFVWSQMDEEQKASAQAQGITGTKYKELTDAISAVKANATNLKALKAGTDGLVGMNSEAAFKTATGTLDKATQNKLKSNGITSYSALTSTLASLNQLDGFTNTLKAQKGNSKEKTYSNIKNTLKKAGFGSMISALPDTYKELAGLLKQYEDGVKEYAQGLEDYKAAPGKLADARQQLADGEKALADGRATLAAGKEKLAEYEDGEQQVRDGLATLMGTEANGGLTSIFDRRNGDDDFDNGDTHLELDEGLEAVGTGREYQADSGALITKEITNRAIGTAAGLGAGALAVLAAILSFLKKNKGAGISAILAAAAGAAGVAVGTSAGMEFSSIAGSVVGATPWVAAGVLAGVALVHAIVHFTGNSAAE